MTRYYLRLNVPGAVDMEVTKEQFAEAEREAGFWVHRQKEGEPCTGGFCGHGVLGRIDFGPEGRGWAYPEDPEA